MSENSEEQPSTGVLGRIGSWLSPWRLTNPTSPTETASPSAKQSPDLELEGESGEAVRSEGKSRQSKEEQREPSSNPDPPDLPRVVFAREGEDATQSATVVSAAEAEPRREESVEDRKKRLGQDKESEKSGSSASVSGNPGKNAGHVTDLSPARIQPWALSEIQAHAGKKLHVYLEETSVVQSDVDRCGGQEVVRTKIPKSLKVPGATKASLRFDSQEASVPEGGQSKRTNARPTAGTDGTLAGGSLKLHKDSQFEDQRTQTRADSMGRRNAARRKVRKNSVGDTGTSPHENKSQRGENVPEGPPSGNSGISSHGQTAKAEDSSARSSPQHNPSSQILPERGGADTSCPDAAEKHNNFKDTNAVSQRSAPRLTDGSGDMEDEDSLYKVERKTETAESKRRSLKVSRTEVKLFTKNVHLNPIRSSLEDNQDTKPILNKDEAKEKPRSEQNTRQHDAKTRNENRKPAAGRIADKISMFERPAGGVTKQAFQTPRSSGASPVSKAHHRLRAGFEASDQTSRAVDYHLKARSSSSSPCRDRLMTVKEQAETFEAVCEKGDAAALPPQSGMTGMPPQTPTDATCGATKSARQDSWGDLTAKERMQTNTESEIALKPDGLDALPAGAKITIPVTQPTGSAGDKASETVDRSAKEDAGVAAKGPGESEERPNNISPQSKGLSKPASRSKRRKSKEFTNSTTPHVESTAINQDQETVVFPTPTEEQQGSSFDERPCKNIEVLEKQEEHSSVIKEDASGQEPEPPVNKDEPDTAADTKTRIDKEAGGKSLSVTQEEGGAPKASREPSAPSSSSSSSIIKQKQEPPVQSRSDQVPLEDKRAGQIMEGIKNDVEDSQETHKDIKLISSKNEGTDKADTSNQAIQTKTTQNEMPQQLSTSLDAAQRTSERRGSGDSEKAEEPPRIRDKQETKSEPLKMAAQKARETEMRHLRGAEGAGRTNETVGGSRGHRKLLEAEKHPPAEPTERTSSATGSAGRRAEKQPDSVPVEQLDNSPGDSCRHGANDAELPAEKPVTEATTASEKVTVQVNHNALPLITARAGDSSVREPALVSASPSLSKEAAGHLEEKNASVINSGPFGDKIPEEAIVPPGSPRKADRVKGGGEAEPRPAGSSLMQNSTANQLSPVANGNISQQQLPLTVKVEAEDDKPGQSPSTPASLEASELATGPAQRSPKKKLNISWELSKEDCVGQQDAPSSWLDVDFPKQRLRVSAPRLSSCGSESNLLDTSGEFDEDDFVEKIKNLCVPFSLPPRKHNPLGPPQPPFALPAIKEVRFEKTFDPDEFKIGLRKPRKYSLETATSTLNKLHNLEPKSGQLPTRASLSDRSILLSSLDTQGRLKAPVNEDDEATEEKVKVKSRLEGSSILGSLAFSLLKEKRDGVQTQAEGTNSGEASPSNVPQPSSPPSCQPPPGSIAGLSQREEAPALANDSALPLPSFTDIKLPDYLEKYLPREARKGAQDMPEQEQLQKKVIEKMPIQQPAVETDAPLQTSAGIPHATPPSFPGKAPLTHPVLTDHKGPVSKRTAKGFHKRPGKIVLFERAQFSGQAYEIYRDVRDATWMQLSALISVKVVRGCWMLYEKPDFQGRTIALEEGGIELNNMWAENDADTDPQDGSPMLIGSMRLVVWDYSVPCIDLFTEPEGRGRITSYRDDTIETGSFGIPLSTASIQVYSGVWLVFSDPGFQGMLAVLEKGEYPFPESWGFPSPFVGSLRPLKMGGFKVENAIEVKVVVYEQPGFQGSCMEIDSSISSFSEGEAADSKKPTSVGSLKVIGGIWVGYSEPGFEGQQHILEEGEYCDSSYWGGSDGLKSLQPVLSDFFSPHIKMFREKDFGGVDIDITVPVTNMEDTGYGTKAQSIDVISGVWAVFEEPGFSGESYILERGMYGCPEDWGALQPRIASAMPVVLSDFETTAKFKVQLFSEPGFQGCNVVLEDSAASLQDGFCVASCKVLSGSWLAFEGANFTGRLYVLEEGSYSSLKAMGCVQGTSILSLQTVGFEFSLPSITLFERGGLRGKRVVLNDGSVNLPLTAGCSRVQSLVVEGGVWVVHEGFNYRGAQLVLRPGEVLDWYKFSSWLKIGSLRPLPQRQVHFRLRNRQSQLLMSLGGDFDDFKMMRIQEMEETGKLEQIWSYRNGYLHCQLLADCCLSPVGSMVMAGSRIGLAAEPDAHAHLWSITPEGFICYTPTHNLVLDIKGGHHYDKNLVILNTLDPSRQQQRWDVEIL